MLICFYVQNERTVGRSEKYLKIVLFAVPYDPNVLNFFFLGYPSIMNTSFKLNAAADLNRVPKFFCFEMLKLSRNP
jgi:hypothetical protein